MTKQDNYILNEYIPALVRYVIKRDVPVDKQGFTEFAQELYEKVKEEEREQEQKETHRLFKEIEEYLQLLHKWKTDLAVRDICEYLIDDFTLTKGLSQSTIEAASLHPDSDIGKRINEYLTFQVGEINGKVQVVRKIREIKNL